MASTFGHSLRLSIFGQSHSEAIGCSLDGLPAGIPVDLESLQAFCNRRAPGHDETSTKRREADRVHVLCGISDGHTCGAPFAAVIENTNTRSSDYSELRRVPRPGHADWPAYVRYGNWHDVAGGGHFSGRLTAPLCAAGGVAIQALEQKELKSAHICSRLEMSKILSSTIFLTTKTNTAPCYQIVCLALMKMRRLLCVRPFLKHVTILIR